MQATLSSKKQNVNFFLHSLKNLKGVTILYTIILFLTRSFGLIYQMIETNIIDVERYKLWDLYRVGFGFFTGPAAWMIIFMPIIGLMSFSFIHAKHGSDLYFTLPIKRGFMYFTKFATPAIALIVPQILIYLVQFLLVLISPIHTYNWPNIKSDFVIYISILILLFVVLAVGSFIASFSGTTFDTLVSTIMAFVLIPILLACIAMFYEDVPGGLGNTVMKAVGMYFNPFAIQVGLVEKADLYDEMSVNSLPFSTLFNIQTLLWVIVGVVCYYVGKHLFKKRKVEKNGFAQPNNLFNIISKILISFSLALIIAYSAGSEWMGNIRVGRFIIFFAIASGLIFFITQAILARGFKGIQKVIPQYAIVWIMLVFVVIGRTTDGFGYSTRLPKEKKVESIQVEIAPYLVDYQINGSSMRTVTVKDKEQVSKMIDAHAQWIKDSQVNNIEKYSEDYYERSNFEFSYNLKNGRMMTREYRVPNDQIKQLYSMMPDAFLDYYNQEYKVNTNLQSLSFNKYSADEKLDDDYYEGSPYAYQYSDRPISSKQKYKGKNPAVWPELIEALAHDTSNAMKSKSGKIRVPIGEVQLEYKPKNNMNLYEDNSLYPEREIKIIKVYEDDEELIKALQTIGFDI